MGNNLTPYSIAKGEENIYFSTPHFRFVKREKINYKELLKANKNSVELFDYHVLKCIKKDSLKKLRINGIHSNYDN